MEWDYAWMSKITKKFGGPKKFIGKIYDKGFIDGKNKTKPWILIAFISGGFITTGINKAINHFKKNKEESEEQNND